MENLRIVEALEKVQLCFSFHLKTNNTKTNTQVNGKKEKLSDIHLSSSIRMFRAPAPGLKSSHITKRCRIRRGLQCLSLGLFNARKESGRSVFVDNRWEDVDH